MRIYEDFMVRNIKIVDRIPCWLPRKLIVCVEMTFYIWRIPISCIISHKFTTIRGIFLPNLRWDFRKKLGHIYLSRCVLIPYPHAYTHRAFSSQIRMKLGVGVMAIHVLH